MQDLTTLPQGTIVYKKNDVNNERFKVHTYKESEKKYIVHPENKASEIYYFVREELLTEDEWKMDLNTKLNDVKEEDSLFSNKELAEKLSKNYNRIATVVSKKEMFDNKHDLEKRNNSSSNQIQNNKEDIISVIKNQLDVMSKQLDALEKLR